MKIRKKQTRLILIKVGRGKPPEDKINQALYEIGPHWEIQEKQIETRPKGSIFPGDGKKKPVPRSDMFIVTLVLRRRY